jgi:Tfp pilus assembly protein FimT
MTLFVVIAGMAVPPVLAGLERSRTHAAGRYLASRMALARAQAVARSASVALRFVDEDRAFGVFVDGNRNGVRSRDIETGVDAAVDPPVRMSALFPGVEITVAGVGASGILSFTPAGTATPGTVSLRGRDGSQVAVRVAGATGRTRVLHYNPITREFEEGS